MIRDRLSSFVRHRAGPVGEAAFDVVRSLARSATTSIANRQEVRLLAETIPGADRLRQQIVRRVDRVAGHRKADTDEPPRQEPVVAEPSRRAMSTAPAHVEHLEGLVDQRLRQLADNWQFQRAADPVEALHELRVASRRLRALLTTFDERLDSEEARRVGRRLRRVTRALGPLRELDVAVAQLTALHARASGDAERAALEYLVELTDRRRSKQRRKTLKAMKSIKRDRIEREVRAVLPSITESSDEELTQLAWSSLRASVEAVFESAPSATSPESPEGMHAMRVAMKKLRYTLELLEPALGHDYAKLHRRSKTQQELLGDHHDVYVLQTHLLDEAKALGARGRPTLSLGLRRVAEHLSSQRVALFQKFRKKRGSLDRDALLSPIRQALHIGELVEPGDDTGA